MAPTTAFQCDNCSLVERMQHCSPLRKSSLTLAATHITLVQHVQNKAFVVDTSLEFSREQAFPNVKEG